MEDKPREFSSSPLPPATTTDAIGQSSRKVHYELQSTAVESTDCQPPEESRRLLLEKDMSNARGKGLWICRLWQFILTLNITIILVTAILIFLLLFIIGPLSPYQTFGQSCRALSCNSAYGLVCGAGSICLCPSTNSYWSYNETGCRRCPSDWSMANGKCLFVSSFNLNWTDALAYCKSFTAQLFTFSPVRTYSSLTLTQISNLVGTNTNYFIGLTEQPTDSGHWQWVDGSPVSASSMTLFCANGTTTQFDTVFRTKTNCGIYRADMTTELVEITNLLRDKTKDNLVVYELEFNQIDDPNEQLHTRAKSQGRCACRLWLILFLTNLAIVFLVIFLILLLLLEIGPVPPFQTYGNQCDSGKCDPTKGLVCTGNGKSKTCGCPSNSWYWYNNTRCRECPPNWIVSNNGTGCYFISSIQLNFTEANLWCMARQSSLVEILNANVFLTFQSINNLQVSLNSFYWIGLRETGPNQNIYRWIQSQLIFFNRNYFCAGQPAHAYNYYFQQYDQCIGIYIQSNTSSCLRDATCSNVSPFICGLYRSSFWIN